MYLGHPFASVQNLRRSSHPPSGALNARGVAKWSDGGPIKGYISYLCHVRVSHLLISFLYSVTPDLLSMMLINQSISQSLFNSGNVADKAREHSNVNMQTLYTVYNCGAVFL